MFHQFDIDPVFIKIGPLSVHWYGLMYLVGLICAYLFALYRIKKANLNWTKDQAGDVLFTLFLGAVLGGRIGYVLFYKFDYFLQNPLFLMGWNGKTIEWAGMSFHGGLLGVLVAALWYAKKHKKYFFEVTDFVAALVPLGLFFGRIGNFINGELWGRPTQSDLPWSFIFRHAPLVNDVNVPRHPSQLYEALLEGLILFIILFIFCGKKNRPIGSISGIFLLGYGIFRSFIEFFREPDFDIGFILGTSWLTKGMLLSLPMIIAGIILILIALPKKTSQN